MNSTCLQSYINSFCPSIWVPHVIVLFMTQSLAVHLNDNKKYWNGDKNESMNMLNQITIFSTWIQTNNVNACTLLPWQQQQQLSPANPAHPSRHRWLHRWPRTNSVLSTAQMAPPTCYNVAWLAWMHSRQHLPRISGWWLSCQAPASPWVALVPRNPASVNAPLTCAPQNSCNRDKCTYWSLNQGRLSAPLSGDVGI